MENYYEQKGLWDRELTPQEVERLDLLREIIPGDVKTILDVGCGSGSISNYLDEKYDITGIDRSEEALKHFKHKKLKGDSTELPVDDGSFDLVICSDVFEHLNDDALKKTIGELKRVAAKYILIISPNAEDLEANQVKCGSCKTAFHVNLHVRSFSFEKLSRKFLDEFSPLVYSHFGDFWANEPREKYLAKRTEGAGYLHWDLSVCPLCGSKQSGAGVNADDEAAKRKDIEANPLLDGYTNRLTEFAAVFVKAGLKKGIFDFDEYTDEQVFMLSKGDDARIERYNRNYIDAGDNVFSRPNTVYYPHFSYLLVNEGQGWEDVTEEGGVRSRLFNDAGGTQRHAIFVFPYIPSNSMKITIEYLDADCADTVLVNIYSLNRGYVNLGGITFTGTHERTFRSFGIPEDVVPANEGFIFELAPGDLASANCKVAICRIYADGADRDAAVFKPEPAGKKVFLNAEYGEYRFDREQIDKTDLSREFLRFKEKSYLYDRAYRCFYYVFKNSIDANLVLFDERDSACSNRDKKTAIINVLRAELKKRDDALENRLQAELKKRDDASKTDLQYMMKAVEGLRDELKKELYQVRESVYTVSNTAEGVIKEMHGLKSAIKHPVGYLARKLKEKIIKKGAKKESKRKSNVKRMVILTPDVAIDRRTVQMCRTLIEKFKIECTIIAALKGSDDFKIDGLTVRRVAPGGVPALKGMKGIWRPEMDIDYSDFYWLHARYLHAAMEEEADYYMCCDLPVLPAGVMAARAKGVPFIYDAHELYPEQACFEAEKRRLYAAVENEFIKYADLTITVNESIADEMAKRYNIKRPCVVLNAINASAGFDINGRYDYFREKLPAARGKKIVLFQGGFSPNRNLENLVKSAGFLGGSDAVIVLMGFGDYGAVLKDLARKEGVLDSRVLFHPAVSQDELLEYSASADVGIIPYPHVDLNSYYCTPNKLFEFVQAGLPILANDSPELNRFVRGNNIGLTRKMDTAEDIAGGITAILSEDRDEYKDNIKKARQIINWDTEAEKFVQDIAPFIK